MALFAYQQRACSATWTLELTGEARECTVLRVLNATKGGGPLAAHVWIVRQM